MDSAILVPEPPLQIAGRLRFVPGYTHGMRYPALVAPLRISGGQRDADLLDAVAQTLDQALADRAAAFVPAAPGTPDRSVLAALLVAMDRTLRAAGVPVLAPGIVTGSSDRRSTVRIPVLHRQHKATAGLLKWSIELLRLLAFGLDTDSHAALLHSHMDDFKNGSFGANDPRFLRAAHTLRIPVLELPGIVMQFGQGSRSRWMESSFTDRTATIGTNLARNKLFAAQILRQAGVPSSRQVLARNAADAVRAADGLGYPVVVKPLDTDGGVAVFTGLRSPGAVEVAFASASEHGSGVLVEKHFEGRDYRMIIMHSELLWASERVPGGVAGDGRTPLRELVERENAARARGAGDNGARYPIVFDEDARNQLETVGMTLDSVPPAGVWVRLRGAANVARGGFARGVMEHVHPDNRLLSIRAAEALRLDLAGVDLLIPDIAKSWRETGALVCEVNAQPDLGLSGPHVYGEVLGRLLEGDGRIPIVVLLGGSKLPSLSAEIARELAEGGIVVGRSGRDGVWVGATCVGPAPESVYTGATTLMTDKRVDAAVIAVDDRSVLRDGLPFDRFDVLVVAEPPDDGSRSDPVADGRIEIAAFLNALVPMCRGGVLTVEGAGLRLAQSLPTADGSVPSTSVPASGVAQAVRRLLLDGASQAKVVTDR